jgi:hypothetical protein
MSSGEGVAGTDFQVSLELKRLFFIREGNISDQGPWPVSGSMHRFTLVMFCIPLAQVTRRTDVALPGVCLTLEQVDVMHGLDWALLRQGYVGHTSLWP